MHRVQQLRTRKLAIFAQLVLVLGVALAAAGISGCGTSGSRDKDPTSNELPGKAIPTLTGPNYLLLDRQNWLDFDQGNAKETIAAALSNRGNRLVLVHDSSVIAWANTSADFAQLKPSITYLPVERIEVQREAGRGESQIIIDNSFAAQLKLSSFINADGRWGRFFAFKANLISYRPTYVFSITRLYAEHLIQSEKVDLRGLPHLYYAFDSLDADSGQALQVASAGDLSIPAFRIAARGAAKYDKAATMSFQNKVFAVDFAREQSYLTDRKFTDFGDPLTFFNIQLQNVERENEFHFQDWKRRASQFFELKQYTFCIIRDAQNHRQYTLTAWERRQLPWSSVWGDWGPNPRLTIDEIPYNGGTTSVQWLQGVETQITPNEPALVSRIRLAPESRDPYNSAWVLYSPGQSLEVITVDESWKNRRTFVRFVH